jgi:hypothetical protein
MARLHAWLAGALVPISSALHRAGAGGRMIDAGTCCDQNSAASVLLGRRRLHSLEMGGPMTAYPVLASPAAEARVLLQLEAPADDAPQLLRPWLGKPPDAASDALPVPVLDPPGGWPLFRSDTSCSKWSTASETQWLPVLELPLGAWSDGGGSAYASSPEALGGGSAPESPVAGQCQGELEAAATEGSEPLQSQPALERRQAAQDSSQRLLPPSSQSAPAALQGRGTGSRPPSALGDRLGSMPGAGLQPAASTRRFVPAEGRGLSGAEAQDPPQASVQLRKSGQLLRRQGSREVLRLLAHAYSELVGGRTAAANCSVWPLCFQAFPALPYMLNVPSLAPAAAVGSWQGRGAARR